MMENVEALLRLMQVQHVVQIFELPWHTVRKNGLERFQREVPQLKFSSVRRIIMDEFAL